MRTALRACTGYVVYLAVNVFAYSDNKKYLLIM